MSAGRWSAQKHNGNGRCNCFNRKCHRTGRHVLSLLFLHSDFVRSIERIELPIFICFFGDNEINLVKHDRCLAV